MPIDNTRKMELLIQQWRTYRRDLFFQQGLSPADETGDQAFAYWLIMHSGWTVEPPEDKR